MHQLAAQWIVELMQDRDIPFLVCGGLAAKGYGSERDLHDIDIFVLGKHFSSVVQAGQEFVSKTAAHRQEEGWDLTYVQFKYKGVKVEVGNADDVRIFDVANQAWVKLNIDLSRYEMVRLLGLDLPIMLREDLIRYKSMLLRPVDVEDISAIHEEA